VLRVAFQNVRALFLASLLAVFSFGTLAILILMLPLALVGYLGSQMVLAGINPLVPWASILPHSILELPAAVLAGAAAVRIGASVLTTQDGKTVGQGWVEAMADATRLWVTLILPVLLLAAVVEIYLTPLLVRWAASGL
jgi:stage II sporulation protein M